jgi:hypothetical protein
MRDLECTLFGSIPNADPRVLVYLPWDHLPQQTPKPAKTRGTFLTQLGFAGLGKFRFVVISSHLNQSVLIESIFLGSPGREDAPDASRSPPDLNFPKSPSLVFARSHQHSSASFSGRRMR